MKNKTGNRMKLALKKSSYLVLAFLIIGVASCSTEDGADGATGPVGATGAQGVAGADGLNGGVDGVDGTNGQDGSDGADGEDGNANVITSAWIDTDFGNSAQTSFSITDPLLTEEVQNTSVVFAYGKLGTSIVRAIPFTYQNRSYSFFMWLNVNKISFVASTTDSSVFGFNGNQDFDQVRYVVIPAGSTSGKSSESVMSTLEAANVDMNNYEEVAAYFGWED